MLVPWKRATEASGKGNIDKSEGLGPYNSTSPNSRGFLGRAQQGHVFWEGPLEDTIQHHHTSIISWLLLTPLQKVTLFVGSMEQPQFQPKSESPKIRYQIATKIWGCVKAPAFWGVLPGTHPTFWGPKQSRLFRAFAEGVRQASQLRNPNLTLNLDYL